MTAAPGVARAPAPHRVAIFSVVALALLMSSLDGTIVATALHAIQHGLLTSSNWTSWVITAYSVDLVLALSLAGKLTERFGRRRFFLASVVVFAGASLCCGLAGSIYLLIVLRGIQAAGGAGFTPSATAIITDNFGEARDKAVGLFGSIFPIGSMIGPIFGGLFVAYWSWRGIFFVNVPIGILLIICCLRYVPRDPDRDGHARRPLDLAGLALFGRHIRRARDPFIAPRLIAGRGFGAVNVINILYGGAVAGMLAPVPLYAVDRYRISVLGSGTLLTAEGIAVIVASSLAAMGLRRTGYRCTSARAAPRSASPAWPLTPRSLALRVARNVRVRDRSRHRPFLAGQPERGPAARAGPVRGHRGAAVNGPDGRADRRGLDHHRDHRPVGGARLAPGQGLHRLRRPAPRLPAGHRPRPRTPRILVRNPGTRHG